jgi:hypothetical protein
MRVQNGDRVLWQIGLGISLLCAALLGAACVLPPAPVASLPSTEAVSSPTPQPPTLEPSTPTPRPSTSTPEPPTATLEPPTAEVADTPQSGGSILDQIFPPGSLKERELVLYNCGSCHSWVCAVIGQRAPESWNSTKATHADRVSGLSQDDLDMLFNFLAENFNDTKPEPNLPEELRSQGCTTQG